MGEALYSYHVFLFPFEWKYGGEKPRGTTLEEKTVLWDWMEALKNTPWKRSAFAVDSRLKYNEYHYFYDFVRESLYDRNATEEDPYICHYAYDIPPDTLEYKIGVSLGADAGQRTYTLLIDTIILHLYSTGVGVLSFHLNNRREDQQEADDILRINQFGRRIFPPFFGMPSADVGTSAQFERGGFVEGLAMVQQRELPLSLSIGDEAYAEDFSGYSTPPSDGGFVLPKCFQHLFKGIPIRGRGQASSAGFQITIQPLLDDRMFVLCWYGNVELVALMQESAKMETAAYPNSEWWYKYVFVDSPGMATMQNPILLKKSLEEHTNVRWLNYGTFFGASRYSFVCLTGTLETLKKPYINAAFLVNHMQTMYYKIVELCLVQRACLLRFSDEVHEISLMKEDRANDLSAKVQSLYREYIRFVNRIYFREVTAQEQGVELYDLLQKHMKIERDVKDLDSEIEELHQYVMLVKEQQRSDRLELLTKLGAGFVIPTFIAGYLGMNVFDGVESNPRWLISILILAIVSGLSVMLLGKGGKSRKIWWRVAILVIVVLAALIALPFILFNQDIISK